MSDEHKKNNLGQGPIGVFDSGYGGLSVLKEIVQALPQYDFLYLGDNARSPYGGRSFTTIYQYTLESVRQLFALNCPLVILACNTASAKALRTIQQKDLPHLDPTRRVLGIIRPTSEIVGNYSRSGRIGVLGTIGTVNSESYKMEIQRFFPQMQVYQQACPLWVPLVESNDYKNPGADFFIQKNIEQLLAQDPLIDTIILGCTHYPLLLERIQKFLPAHIKVLCQGEIVAQSLVDYLQRHPEISSRCSQQGGRQFYTTETVENFDAQAAHFFEEKIRSQHLSI